MLDKQFSWDCVKIEGLCISWKVVKLTLRRTFTTAHSSSDTRNNFFFRIASDNSQGVKGFGECGLPPKKKLCYLADINDCRDFANDLRTHLIINEKSVSEESLNKFKSELFQDIPVQYFRYFYEQNIDNGQFKKLMHHILLILYWAYHIKQPRFKAAISALQYALFDFFAKTLKLSLTNFIFSPNHSLQTPPFSFYTLSYEQNQIKMIQNALQFLQFTSFIKIKYVDNIISLLYLVLQLQQASKGRVKGYIIDANASWKVQSYRKFNQLIQTTVYDHIRSKIMYVEQPFPIEMDQKQYEQWKQLKNESKIKIMIDQSFSSYEQVDSTLHLGHAINIKSQKAGGPISCLRAALYAKRFGIEVMLGSMVSTHLGCNQTYCLYSLTQWLDVDGSLLVQSPNLQGGFQWGGQASLKKPQTKYYGLQIDTSKIQ